MRTMSKVSSTSNDQGSAFARSVLALKSSKVKKVAGGREGPGLKVLDAEIALYEKDPDAYLEPEKREVVDTIPRHSDGTPIITGVEYIWPGINMSDIARASGLSLGGVSRIFNGKRRVKLHTSKYLASLFTNDDLQALRAVIRERVLRIVNRDRGRGLLTVEEAEAMIRRVTWD